MNLWIAVVLFAAGALPAVAAVGLRPEAVPLSALSAALVCTLAGMAALATGTPVLPWAAVFVLLVNGVGLAVVRRRLASGSSGPAGRRQSGLRGHLPGLAVLAAAAVPLAALRRPVVDWDARSIWSFHGRWFYAGGDYLREALANGAFEFSHSDYPPAIPATIGVLWRLGGDISPRTGQVALGLLNFSAVALIGLAVAGLGTYRRPAVHALTGVLAVLAAYGIAATYAMNGYADLLWGAGAAAAAVFLLVAPVSRNNLVLGIVALAVAGLAKNEGTLVALLILALAAMRHRARGIRLVPFAACAGTLVAWPLLARFFGADSDFSGSVVDVVAGRLDVVPRVGPVVEAFGGQALVFGLVAAAVSVAGLLVLREARKRMSLGSGLWTWCAIAGTAFILGAAYLASPNDVRWHLATSVDRTTIGLKLLLLVEVLSWAAVSLERLFATPATLRSAGDD